VPLARVDDVITDSDANPDQLRELGESGVRIHTV
jgi:hypothetical protein